MKLNKKSNIAIEYENVSSLTPGRRTFLKMATLGIAGTLLLPLPRLAHSAQGNMLIVYYSLTEKTKRVADTLQRMTGADTFRLETVVPYDEAAIERVQEDQAAGRFPELKALPDLSGYDLILVGSPVWWYTLCSPVVSFLRQTDFAGKRTAAFATHMGWLRNTLPDFGKQARNAHVLEGTALQDIENIDQPELNDRLDAWVKKLTQA